MTELSQRTEDVISAQCAFPNEINYYHNLLSGSDTLAVPSFSEDTPPISSESKPRGRGRPRKTEQPAKASSSAPPKTRKAKARKVKAPTVAEIRAQLKSLGLPTGGTKQVLLQRLAAAQEQQNDEGPCLEETNHGVRLMIYGRPWFYLNKIPIEHFIPLTRTVTGDDMATLSACLSLFSQYLNIMSTEMLSKAENLNYNIEHMPHIDE